MKMRHTKNLTVLLIFTMMLSTFSAIVVAEGVPGLELPVEVDVIGTPPTSGNVYTIILKAEKTSNPMPDGSVGGEYSLKMPGDSTRKFPNIEFPSLGVYNYEVYQSPNIDSSYGYDNKKYDLKIYVTNAKNGGLEITVRAYPFGETKKDEIIFNPEAKPPTPPYNPPSGGGGGTVIVITPDTPVRPRVPEEPEEEIEEEIPEAEPEVPEEEIEEEVPEAEPEVPEEEIEEEVPEAKPIMPKTGQVPTSIYYAIGVGLVGLGLGFRKKEDE